jgi:hypothetical protein
MSRPGIDHHDASKSAAVLMEERAYYADDVTP